MLDRINIGEFDRRITLQFRSITRDATYNQPVEAWQSGQITVWAKIIFTPGSENIEADQIRTMRKRSVMIRYSSAASSIKESDRWVEGSEVYNITSVNVKRREGYIVLIGDYKDESETT